ncbi:MAG TPA: sugar-binding transcriptional regulator [Thiolinea sp.]|nr:sugar-binding transcriptional regulator [Thiolinea sp.]
MKFPGKRNPDQISEEDSMAARAAWLHYSGGLTQSEVARRFGIPQPKAHRLIARAFRDGLVQVFVDTSVRECIELENTLSHAFGLDYCKVVPVLDEGPLPLRTLGLAGADFLRLAIESGEYRSIGIGHGRTLASVVQMLPGMEISHMRFVSLLGGLTRKFAANPFDVIHRLAEKTGAEAYMLPVPIFANSAQDKQVLMAQLGIAEVLAMGREADLLLAGIGEVDWHSHLVETGMVMEAELEELQQQNARGEMLGHYFDADGALVKSGLNDRAMSLAADDLRGHRLIAIAGGEPKVEALRAVLNSGLLTGLITDERSAQHLTSPFRETSPG